MRGLAVLLVGCLVGYALAVAGAFYATVWSGDYRWGFLGLVPGVAVFVAALLCGFGVGRRS